MGPQFLIDTNTLIDAQMSRLSANGMQFLADTMNEDFTVSCITYIEFLGYRSATQATEDFIALATLLDINKAVMDTCIGLRKTVRIKTPDAIIAATALVYGLTLLTHDDGFNRVPGLVVVDPHSL
jgi:predicted nucleic acid-binding protein